MQRATLIASTVNTCSTTLERTQVQANMPPPDNGNEKIPFTKLIALDKISADTFRSTALAFAPAGGARTYGGHVYMQACYAAAQTVGKDFVLHVGHLPFPIMNSSVAEV